MHSAAHILYADAKSRLPKQQRMPAGTVSCAVQDTQHLTLTIPGVDLPLVDRRQHFYVLGGREERLAALLGCALYDIERTDRSVIFFDLDGKASPILLDAIPSHRIRDTFYWHWGDRKYHVGFNLLEGVLSDDRPMVADTIVRALQQMLGSDAVGHRSAYVLSNILISLMDAGNATLWSLEPLLVFPKYQSFISKRTRNTTACGFWQEVHDWQQNPKFFTEAMAPVKNKIAMFFGNPLIRNVYAQLTSTINFPSFLQSKKIIIINLDQQTLGSLKAKLVGNLLLAHLALVGSHRTPPRGEALTDCNVYLNVHSYAEDMVASLLQETTNRLNLMISSPTIGHRRGEFSACGNLVAFKCGVEDTRILEGEFGDLKYTQRKIMEHLTVGLYPVVARFTDGAVFHSNATEVIPSSHGRTASIINYSRNRYTRRRSRIERKLSRLRRTWGEMDA
jgi:hypothetical protein